MSCEKHSFVNEHGYKCCISCGISILEHYWNDDLTHEANERNMSTTRPKFMRYNKDWKRLSNLNKNLTTAIPNHIYREILTVINALPLSSVVKKNLHNYMTSMKIRSYDEVCKTFYNLICKHDLPITTSDFIDILQSGKKYRYKLLTKLRNVSNVRRYYWYINKEVQKAKELIELSNEESQDIYKIVLNYYNLIRFKMLKTSNPISLIQNLVYYTIREIFRPNQKVFNKRVFGLTNVSYITTLVRYLKEIRIRDLDSQFSERLLISKRNKRLEMVLA